MAVDGLDLALRIIVENPVPGVALALQKGKSGAHTLIAPTSVSPQAAAFDLSVVAAPAPTATKAGGPAPRLLGPFVQGPPDKRFVYISIGTYAGDPASPWGRRAKVPLTGLNWPLIEALQPGGRLEARIPGRDRKGEPACASLALLPPGWRPVP